MGIIMFGDHQDAENKASTEKGNLVDSRDSDLLHDAQLIIDQDTPDHALDDQPRPVQNSYSGTGGEIDIIPKCEIERLAFHLQLSRTALEIWQLPIFTHDLQLALNEIVLLISQKLGFHARIDLLDETSHTIEYLADSESLAGTTFLEANHVGEEPNSVIKWVVDNREVFISGNVPMDDRIIAPVDHTNTASMVALPVELDDEIIGVLELQHLLPNVFDEDAIAILGTIAGSIASKIHTTTVIAQAQTTVAEIASVYRAGPLVARSNQSAEVFSILRSTLQASPIPNFLYAADRTGLQLVGEKGDQLIQGSDLKRKRAFPKEITIDLQALVQMIGIGANYKIIELQSASADEAGLGKLIQQLIGGFKHGAVALVPGWYNLDLRLLFLLWGKEPNSFSLDLLEAYSNLAKITSLTLERIYTAFNNEKQSLAIETLNNLNRVLSEGEQIDVTYQTIHTYFRSIFGQVIFTIAIYDVKNEQIVYPFYFDGKETTTIDSTLLGDDFASMIIRAGKPMINAVNQVDGTNDVAGTQGVVEKGSVIGVPLIFNNAVFGAIIVENPDQGSKFSEYDLKLVEILALPLSMMLQNKQYLQINQNTNIRQKQLSEIISKLNSSPDSASIIQTAVSELSKVLGARNVSIELGSSPTRQPPSER